MRLFGKDLSGPPIIVAEISANHNGSLDRACELINAAKNAGADAVKIQAYEPGHLTIQSDRPEFIVESPLWKGRTLWDLYSEARTPTEWIEPMFRYAADIGIPIFASVFHEEIIPLLERLKTPAYKIASFEITDIPLIKAVAETGKPIIISTGMAKSIEIQDALCAINWKNDTFLLHCVSGYPTQVTEANLRRMVERRMMFEGPGRVFGLSDHSPGYIVPVLATALGAKLIEKHLCLSRADGGPDAAFSMEPGEFKEMVQAVHDAWAALQPSPSPSEDVNRKYRRSLYVVKDVKKGEPFTRENVRSIRPDLGLNPKRIPDILKHLAATDLAAGVPLSDQDIDIASNPPEAPLSAEVPASRASTP